MDQIGINQIGMNPVIMNQMPMNQMDINSQFNQMNYIGMDNTTLNIRNIVQPYEKKIKELEELLRQKDFEITVLKQKLNNINPNNNFINMNIGMNPMMLNNNINQIVMIGNNNQQLEDKGEKIQLTLKSADEEFKIICFEGDCPSDLVKKYNLKAGLTFNYKSLIGGWSLKKNGIKNFSVIEVKNCKNITFQTARGDNHNLAFSEDFPIGLAIVYYIITYENPILLLPLLYGMNSLNNIIFTYNAKQLSVKDTNPISKIFNNINPLIRVDYRGL